ncbi:MAG TPA: HAD-IC family P-type ATPase, partial [Candidatus Deferrimicrobium sp.]|nr:HAD-IC family P-type ATPase [Candidatus Deferrimicrobium sp.]
MSLDPGLMAVPAARSIEEHGAVISEPVAASVDRDEVRGLTTAEAEALRRTGQGNEYRSPTSRSYLEIFRESSYPWINGPLLLVAIALIALGAVTEAAVTALPVFFNIAIGVIQGSRAKRQLDRVALLSQAPATILRDGVERQLPPSAIVLGDVVVANRGDEIQVDGRMVGPGSASVDESALTGESDPVDKSAGDPVRSGSAVVSGVVRYLVEAVGADTFANGILAQAKGRRDVRTPLQSDIARAFGVVAVLIILAGLIVAISLPDTVTDPTRESVFAAAVLITLVPQGLALMLTVTYAAAAVRISRLGALTQRQSSIEAISRIDTFCSDKTGTLTTQRICFGAIEHPGPAGSADLAPAEVGAVLAAIAASTTAPNATMLAIRTAWPGPALPVVAEVPFSSALRWSAIRLGALGGGHPAASATWVLGAPDVLATAISGGAAVMARA